MLPAHSRKLLNTLTQYFNKEKMMSHLLKISTLSLIVDISELDMATTKSNNTKKDKLNTKDNMSNDIATDVTTVNKD